MPPSMNTITNTRELIPVLPHLRRRLWLALLGAGLFNITVLLESLLRPDYDAYQQSVSALSLGRWGWIQTINFIFLGAIIISTVPAWRKILEGGKGASAYPALTLVTGITLILCGILKQDPAPGYDPEHLALTAPSLVGALHLLFAAIGALSSIIGLIVMARRFAHTPLWQGWNIYSIIMAVIMAVCVTVYSVWSTKSTGFAGTFERIAILIVPIWVATFLIRLKTGVAFMNGIPESHNQKEAEVNDKKRL
jgi:hypothetical protein